MKKKTTYSLIALLGIVILAILYIGFHSFSKEKPTKIAFTSQETPNIYPDYKEVNIPYNIAPLNFRIDDDIDKCYVQVTDDSGSITEFYGENHIVYLSPLPPQKTRLGRNGHHSLFSSTTKPSIHTLYTA